MAPRAGSRPAARRTPTPSAKTSGPPGGARARSSRASSAPTAPNAGAASVPSEAGTSYSPVQQSSSRGPDEDVDDEVDAIVAALREVGAEGLDRRALGDRVHCRLWGPGRFRHALSVAQQRELVRPASRGRYVAGPAVRSGR